eukprot:148398_1
MVRLYSDTHTFSHPWSTVSMAFWRKYPSIGYEHIKHVDTFARSFDRESQTLTVHRLFTIGGGVPAWMISLGINPTVFAVEKAVVNARTNSLVLHTRNFSGRNLFETTERCEYKASVDDPKHRTVYVQKARIISFTPFFSDSLEEYSFSNIVENATKGLDRIESLSREVAIETLENLSGAVEETMGNVRGSIDSLTTELSTSSKDSSAVS